jgi:8-oxo-dGTP pyrophosphatase MutT (NUDIX family)
MSSDGRWHRRDSHILFAGGPQGRIQLTVDQAVRPDGVTVAYPHVVAPDSVRVLAVHRGRIALVTQHHYLHDMEITDLPGGLVDADEEPADAARRELEEETGLTASWLQPLGAVATARGATTETAHLFLAHGCTQGPASPEAGESLRVQWVLWRDLGEIDFMTFATSGPPALADAASLAAVQEAGARLRAVGLTLPARDAGLVRAAWAAYTVAAARDPIADERLSLVWLDLALGRYPQGAAIVAELEAQHDGADSDAAWERAAEQFLALVRPGHSVA